MFAVSPHDPQFQEPGSLFNSWCPHGKRSQRTLAEVTGARLKVLEKLQDALKVGLALENTLFLRAPSGMYVYMIQVSESTCTRMLIKTKHAQIDKFRQTF